jgi:SAM-dependent methyltransferase
MTRLPFAEGSFDAVVAAEVIEHIPEVEIALAEAARVLRPGGRLVVTVPYRETLRRIRCPECGEEFEPNGHVHSFDETRLESLLRGAGLEPGAAFVGNTRFSREILRRAPIAPLLPVLRGIDRLTYRSQRVSDTWMLMSAQRPRGG